jgi:hypothetical protein
VRLRYLLVGNLWLHFNKRIDTDVYWTALMVKLLVSEVDMTNAMQGKGTIVCIHTELTVINGTLLKLKI